MSTSATSTQGLLLYQMTTLRRIFLEPVSAVTHLVAALAALLGLFLLVALTYREPTKMLTLAVYGLSLVLLFAASALLHGLKAPRRIREWLNRLDHMAIFLVIAGTYTPIVFNLFPRHWRWPILVVIWGAALVGMIVKLTSARIHGFFNVSIYLILGWGGALPLMLALQLRPVIPHGGLALLLLGGIIYSSGFVIYYLRWPDPWPAVIGHHEIWHLFVIGGSICHFLFMLQYVVPAAGVG